MAGDGTSLQNRWQLWNSLPQMQIRVQVTVQHRGLPGGRLNTERDVSETGGEVVNEESGCSCRLPSRPISPKLPQRTSSVAGPLTWTVTQMCN